MNNKMKLMEELYAEGLTKEEKEALMHPELDATLWWLMTTKGKEMEAGLLKEDQKFVRHAIGQMNFEAYIAEQYAAWEENAGTSQAIKDFFYGEEEKSEPLPLSDEERHKWYITQKNLLPYKQRRAAKKKKFRKASPRIEGKECFTSSKKEMKRKTSKKVRADLNFRTEGGAYKKMGRDF